MYVIGVTGPSGAGKSLFCSYLREAGCLHLDCDKIYHAIIAFPSPCTQALAAEFGDTVLNPDGSICRPALADIVFAPNAQELRGRLNMITHAFVLDEVRRSIASTDKSLAVIDAPLLFEAGYDKECDLTVAVLASPEQRLARLRMRDSRPLEALRARMAAAPSDDFYSSRASITLINEGDPGKLREAASTILKKIKK